MTAMTSEREALLPCPFCGGEAVLYVRRISEYDAVVVCNDCGSEGALYGGDDYKGDHAEEWKQNAIAAWNRRAHLSQPAQAVDVELELWQDGEPVAGASGPREAALSEMRHYLMMYGQDGGKLEVFEVTRTNVTAAITPKDSR